MEYRMLGRTGLQVGVIGLGTEYLTEASRRTVVSVVREAVASGVNYFDVLYAFAHYRDNFGAAFAGLRDRLIVAGHLGSAEKDGQYRRTRDVAESEALIHDLLRRLHTDCVDVLFLSNCDARDDYRRLMAPGGFLELARRFREQGKARFIGFSGHKVPVALRAVASGAVDVLMHMISLSGDAEQDRKALYHRCVAAGVGLIGMKPYAGGVLLQGTAPSVTPVQCLSYALSQPGVSTVVPGVRNLRQLRAALAYLDASDEERDFSAVLPHSQKELKGTCVYCNHCLPCPAGIDVGRTLRLLGTARYVGRDACAAEYGALKAKASDCIECGACMERCPFQVDVMAALREAAGTFEEG
jgi:hypothetical protein